MSNESLVIDYCRQIASDMEYRFYMEKTLAQDNTRVIADAIQSNAEWIIKSNEAIGAKQVNAINNQTNTINKGFESLNNTLAFGFGRMEYQLGQVGASFTAGAVVIIDATFKMSEALCDKIDILTDIVNNPRRTEAREFYRDGVRNFLKGFFEEARDFLKQAIEKDKTDYRSWYLLGIIYLRGKGKYSDVINLDEAIISLTNAIKYFSPEITEYEKIMPKDYKNDLIKKIKSITGLSLPEAKDIVEYGNVNKVHNNLPDIPINPKLLAAEILFYLLGKRNVLNLTNLNLPEKMMKQKIFFLKQ